MPAHLLLIFASLSWGGSYAVGRYGLDHGSALWLTLWRWGPGAIFFTAYLIATWHHVGHIIQANWKKLVLISLLGIVVYPATLFVAVAQTTALNAALYLSASPVLIVFMSAVFWKERISASSLFSLAAGLLGAFILVFRGDIGALVAFRIAKGDVWAIVSAVAWAGYCVSLPLKPAQLGETPFLAALIVIGSVLLFVFSLIAGDPVPVPNAPKVAWSIIYFAIFPSVLAFLAWNRATAIIGPSDAAPYNNLVPFFGGALGILALGESIEEYHLWGGGLILFGLLANNSVATKSSE